MAGPAPSTNRRLYYRQPMYLRINLRVAGIRVLVPATLVDISGGGAQIHARTMLKPKASVEFDLPRPGDTALRLTGTIRKVTYTPDNRTFRYAVHFESLESGVREQLLRFVIEEQRRGITGSKDAPEATSLKVASTRLRELRSAHRVEVNVPVRYFIGDSLTAQVATAIDIGTGGLRMILDQVLRQEWVVTVRFTLPNETLKVLAQSRVTGGPAMRPFSELKFLARPLSGVKQLRGRFVQSLAFVNPDAEQAAEIDRFVQASRLTTIAR